MAPQLLKFHIGSISRLLHSTPSLSFLSLSKTPKLSSTLSISFYVDLWSNYCFFLFKNDFIEMGQSPNSVSLEAMLLQVQERFNHQRSKLF